jgi:putative transposase
MRNPRFVDDQIYHVYNRGVEKRIVFQDPGDHLRFIHHLFELNDAYAARNLAYHLSKSEDQILHTGKRKQLVNILAFALMPNHFHLLLQQNEEGGISKFMQKLGTGYTMFFNEKNSRTGGLFQGKFKAVHVTNDVQLRYVTHYIHLNPLALCAQESSPSEKIRFLREYKWSSLPDYIGARGFPSVTHRVGLLDMFEGVSGYQQSFTNAMAYKSRPDGIDSSLLMD